MERISMQRAELRLERRERKKERKNAEQNLPMAAMP